MPRDIASHEERLNKGNEKSGDGKDFFDTIRDIQEQAKEYNREQVTVEPMAPVEIDMVDEVLAEEALKESDRLRKIVEKQGDKIPAAPLPPFPESTATAKTESTLTKVAKGAAFVGIGFLLFKMLTGRRR